MQGSLADEGRREGEVPTLPWAFKTCHAFSCSGRACSREQNTWPAVKKKKEILKEVGD